VPQQRQKWFDYMSDPSGPYVEQERGAAKERERNTYRNEDGEELFCPRCGGPDPEGYTRKVLDS